MAGVIGSIGPFDESIEQWSSYTERFDYFVVANGISDDKIVPTFLSVMGPKTCYATCYSQQSQATNHTRKLWTH